MRPTRLVLLSLERADIIDISFLFLVLFYGYKAAGFIIVESFWLF